MALTLPARIRKSERQDCRGNILFFVRQRTQSNTLSIPQHAERTRAERLPLKNMSVCAKQTAGNWQLERFRSLRTEFSKLLSRFRETEDHGERLRLMESAHRIIDEARHVMEQYRQRLPAKLGQPVIEIQNRTTNQSQTQRPKRKNGLGDIVAFRPHSMVSPKACPSSGVHYQGA
jgi:hypothetical protein